MKIGKPEADQLVLLLEEHPDWFIGAVIRAKAVDKPGNSSVRRDFVGAVTIVNPAVTGDYPADATIEVAGRTPIQVERDKEVGDKWLTVTQGHILVEIYHLPNAPDGVLENLSMT